MRKSCFVISFLVVVAVASARPSEESSFITKYDNVDLKQILNSDRLTKNYVDCLLEKKPCTPDGAELKDVLPALIKNQCEKCNKRQRDGGRTVIHHLYKNKRSWWDALEEKYDPEGTYVKEHEAELKDILT